MAKLTVQVVYESENREYVQYVDATGGSYGPVFTRRGIQISRHDMAVAEMPYPFPRKLVVTIEEA